MLWRFWFYYSWGDIGIAVIVLTLLVKTALYPLSQRSIESQTKMNLLSPELKKIKASGASKEEQAKQTMELYKKTQNQSFFWVSFGFYTNSYYFCFILCFLQRYKI